MTPIDGTIAQQRPHVHLWIYNHPFNVISDQIDYFLAAMRQHGYGVTVGRSPNETALNVVIENFSGQTRDVLIQFCRMTRKRVAVIMTEHLDFINGQMFIHGDPLGRSNDYMHPVTQINRIRFLFECLKYIRCFLVLGDLPEMKNASEMLPGIDVRAIPFPKIQFDAMQTRTRNPDPEKRELRQDVDFLFTGFVTEYRHHIIETLKRESFSIACPPRFVSRKNRDTMNRSARVVLNIPQREEWRWLSLMRVIAALRCGRPTVSLGTQDTSQIALCCEQLDIRRPDWLAQLQAMCDDSQALYRKSYDSYMAMAEQFEATHGFPHDMFEFWTITDRLQRVTVR